MIGTIRFHLRKDRINKKGFAPVLLFYSIAGDRQHVKTGLLIKPHNWNSDIYRGIYLDKKTASKLYPEIEWKHFATNSEIEDINYELVKIETIIVDIEKSLKNNIITSKIVMDEYKSGHKPLAQKGFRESDFFDMLDKYILTNKNSRAQGSVQPYISLKSYLQGFEVNKKIAISFGNIDYNFFAEYRNFLISNTHKRYYKMKNSNEFGKAMDYKLKDSTVAKQIATLKSFLNYCKKSGIKINDSYNNYTIKRKELGIVTLNLEEVKTMSSLNLDDKPGLDKVRDIFIFACLTGLRISDLEQFKRVHIKGNTINLTVKKTKNEIGVPITRKAKEILDKYSELDTPLPKISSQKINKQIKKIGELAGINEPTEKISYYGSKAVSEVKPKYEFLTIHIARKTFASISINNGVSTSIVKAIGGWTSESSFKRYVKVTADAKETAMKNTFNF